MTSSNETTGTKNDPDRKQFVAYLRAFIVPTLFLKVGIIYFGLNYSSYPGEGYGYGLAISVLLSLINFGMFIWMNWQDEEER